jgi:Mg2+ and Co2+ transporter CorA
MKTKPPFKKPPRDSLLDDVIYWATTLSNDDITVIPNNPSILAYRALQVICAEWFTITTYITTRLTQIEYELAEPSFRNDPSGIQSSLAKLHIWHHKVPISSAILRDTQDTLSRDRPLVAKDSTDCMRELKDDVEHVYNEMGRLGQRIERIMALATAIASMEESRRAIQQNQNLGRLTYLAVIFAPLAFVSSFFSMAADLGALKETFWVYFAVAAPLSAVVFLIVDFERLRRAVGGWVEGRKAWIRKRVATLVFGRTSSSAKN